MADTLDAECRVFCRYLASREPTDYLLATYRAAHVAGVVEPEGGSSSFERGVVSLARSSSLFARAFDARARILAPGSLLRRKLVLVLSILEVSAETEADVDTPTHKSLVGLGLHLVGLGLAFGCLLIAGVLLSPLAFVVGGAGGGTGNP